MGAAGKQEDLSDIHSYARYMHQALIRFVDDNRELSKHLMSRNMLVSTFDMIVKQVADGITQRIHARYKAAGHDVDIPAEYLGLFYAGGVMVTLHRWIIEGRPLPARKLEGYSTKLLMQFLEQSE
jgi:hypothetical protein